MNDYNPNDTSTYLGRSRRRTIGGTMTNFATPSKVDLAKVELQIAQRKLDKALAAEKTAASKTSLFGCNDDYEVGVILVVTKQFDNRYSPNHDYTYVLRKYSATHWSHSAQARDWRGVDEFDAMCDLLLADATEIDVQLVTQVEEMGAA